MSEIRNARRIGYATGPPPSALFRVFYAPYPLLVSCSTSRRSVALRASLNFDCARNRQPIGSLDRVPTHFTRRTVHPAAINPLGSSCNSQSRILAQKYQNVFYFSFIVDSRIIELQENLKISFVLGSNRYLSIVECWNA